MIRVCWHITRRFYEVRASRASSKGLTDKHRHLQGKAMKYSSLIEHYEAHHKSPEPQERRLPSGWWLIVAALAYALVYVLATWAVLA
ncbi:hypothetical protein GQF56_15430 [Rhodobacter sphaeroides]|jgi:hypothetical protein|uniref:Uncharacterized protein n=2 Tax=Cereibacter sphaeroides TaxID=1063 RepID=Q3IVN7_CERS4|nr:hypothetical protein RSP_3773 [Cereibacter sphaeroides 2.4.1]AMJ49685.1 hypothetical protein APX01_19265 [Cereibacter sphaeroides]ANS36400.1 hypothetical protein A3858_19270 [Cereibacter sphaeroides]ATN65457.1 hypothetical protein A3857_19295 [Cereibacter sphaeroides]AXC63682.1 hypothetical protein DQL45_20135 [Cereibacter sphaeroides 2.4.1]